MRLWLETAAYCASLHFVLWDMSRSYREALAPILERLRAWWQRLNPTRLRGRLAADVGAAWQASGGL